MSAEDPIEREASGLPTDAWLLQSSDRRVAAWLHARVCGLDGICSERNGEDPAEGVHLLLTDRPHDIQVKLVFALADVLNQSLAPEGSNDPVVVKRLLHLASTVGFLPPSLGTRCLVKVIERHVADRPRWRASLLRARSQLAPRAPRALWESFLTHADCRFEALRCARRWEPDVALAAFETLVRSGVEATNPVLRVQLARIQEDVQPLKLSKCLSRLSAHPATAAVGRALLEMAFPVREISDARAAFVKPQEPVSVPSSAGQMPPIKA